MEISREDQKQFAREIVSISERDPSPETLTSLKKVVSLLVSWVGEDNGVAVNLSEYIGELKHVKDGGEDTGWLEDFKKTLEHDLSSESGT
jgi:hypothetical protein